MESHVREWTDDVNVEDDFGLVHGRAMGTDCTRELKRYATRR